jgi:SAM-dependent methyltransferase
MIDSFARGARMTDPTFDPAAYKSAQREDWTDAAAGWRQWWPKLEVGIGPVAQHLVELAEVKEGDRVLDVATGIGEPAVTAARRVGARGHVIATDIAPGMLEIGRERAAELGLSNIEFREADAEDLDLPDQEFDAALSRFGLMFFPDLGEALQRIRRSLVPGGRFAAAVWGAAERTPFLSLAFVAVARELRLPPPGPGVPGPFSLADRERLEDSLREAGFTDVRSEVIKVSTPFESAAEYVAYMRAIAAPIKNALARETEHRREEVWDAVGEAVRSLAGSDGSVELGGEVIDVVGSRG